MARRRKTVSADRQLAWGDGYVDKRILASGRERYQARWPEPQADGTVRFASKTFDTREQAEEHIRNQIRAIRSGTYTPESKLTVREAVTEYLDRGAHRWTSNTLATYRLTARNQVFPLLGDKKLVELTPRMVQLWIDALTPKVSASVIENARLILSGAIKEAIQLGVPITNPVSGLRLPKRKKTPIVTWTPEHVRMVLESVKSDTMVSAFYLTALMTGIRPGEIRALMWGDIDFDHATIVVQRTMTRDANFRAMVGSETKTHRNRTIAITMPVIDALKRWRADQRIRRVAHPDWQDTGIVFDRGNGEFLPLTTLETIHNRTIATAGVPKIRLHALRHSFASIALANGANVKVISDMLGHASIATTLDIYAHPNADMHRSMVEGLGMVLFGTDGDPNQHAGGDE